MNGLSPSSLIRRFPGGGLIFKQLRNTKVQQFDRAIRRHQNIARLDVAVNHQERVGMGVG